MHIVMMMMMKTPSLSSSPSPSPLPVLMLIICLVSLCGAVIEAAAAKCGGVWDHNRHGSKQVQELRVLHINSPCSSSPLNTRGVVVTWEDSVLQTQSKDESRLQHLMLLVTKKTSVPIAWGRQIIQSPTYIVRVQIGSPPQSMLMAMDTSNDVAWIPCTSCVGCTSSSSAPLFDSTKSTTFKPLPCQATQCQQVPNPTCGGSACTFNMTYGGSSIAANVCEDTFTLATDPIADYTFGCIQKSTGSTVPPQGLLGLGRGPLSLLSQSQSLYQSTFSYCLPSSKSPNFSGSLRLGPVGQPKRIKYTPLLKNPRRPSLYYVNLMGIRVGSKIVNIPPESLAFNPTTGAGTIFDSGTVYSRLVAPAYTAVRDEFRKRVGGNQTVTSLGGFDTCYSAPIVAPTITFMFAGGMNVTLPQDNFLIHSTAGSTTCLAMAAAPTDNLNSVLNVIANMQQQNHRILFDLPNSRIGVARETCS